jgi:ABC-2 type transport system permease protein
VSLALNDVGLIAWRSVRRTVRQPANVIAPLTFPILLLAINSSGLRAATHIPGFPTDSFVSFFLPFAFIQGALFAAMTAGTDLARDIDTGFLNRLALTPLRGTGLLAGQLGGAMAQALVQAFVYLGVGLAFGVHFASGLEGIVVLILLALAVGAAWGAVGIWIALRTGSGEAVQSQFPILFFFIIISSMNLPRNLIEADWFRTAATLNPVSYMIEGLRSLIIEGWDAQALALGFGFAILSVTVAMALAAVELRKQMART